MAFCPTFKIVIDKFCFEEYSRVTCIYFQVLINLLKTDECNKQVFVLFINFWLVFLMVAAWNIWLVDWNKVAALVCSSLFSTKSRHFVDLDLRQKMWFLFGFRVKFLENPHDIYHAMLPIWFCPQNPVIWLSSKRDDRNSEWMHWSVTVQLYTQVPAC